jgi:drug/metabolite transporter (DMT)-like permease
MLATFIWGAGFVGTRWTLEDYSPLWSNSLRFVLAGGLVLPFVLPKWRKLLDWKPFFCSFLLFVALLLQTYGIKYTTLAKSGFLTTFYAIFTPIISMIFFKVRFSGRYWALVFMAMFGIALLCDLEFSNFNRGDLFILCSALIFSLHILYIDKLAKIYSALDLNFFQSVYIALFGFTIAWFFEGLPDLSPLLRVEALTEASSLWGFIILAVFSSLVAFTIQIIAQKNISPSTASLIFLGESVFSAFFGWLVFAEELSAMGLGGAFLVILSVALVPLTLK